jgi:HSP20 family molecular chaperone IbpA
VQQIHNHPFPASDFIAPLRVDDILPRFADDGKSMWVSINIPEQIDPTKLTASVKDNELILRAEDRTEKREGVTSYSFFQRRNLPPNTDLNAIKITVKDHKLTVRAPLRKENDNDANGRPIPIERESKNNHHH